MKSLVSFLTLAYNFRNIFNDTPTHLWVLVRLGEIKGTVAEVNSETGHSDYCQPFWVEGCNNFRLGFKQKNGLTEKL